MRFAMQRGISCGRLLIGFEQTEGFATKHQDCDLSLNLGDADSIREYCRE